MFADTGIRYKTLRSWQFYASLGGSISFILLLWVIGFLLAPDRYSQQPLEADGYLQHKVSATVNSLAQHVSGLSSEHFNGQWWFYLKPTSSSDTPIYSPFEVLLNISTWTDRSRVTVLHDELIRLSLDVYCMQDYCKSQVLASEFYVEDENVDFTVIIPKVDSNGDDSNLQRALAYDSLGTKFIYINHSFWVFELTFRYCFLIATAVVMALYIWALWKSGIKDMLPEQKFVLALLFCLFWFNNPFFMADLVRTSRVWPTLNAIFIFSYVCMVMLLILVFSHGIIKEDEHCSFVRFYLPKFILVGLFWSFNMFILVSMGMGVHNSPQYADYTSFKGHLIIYSVSCAILGVYVLHMVWVVCQVIGHWKKLRSFTWRFKVLWLVNLFVLLFTWLALAMVVYEHDSGAEFLTLFGIYNCYSWCMALWFSPTAEKGDVAHFLHSRFGDSGDDQHLEMNDHDCL